jgi:branched-chain amino acid transport system ATP-binding protein
MLRLNSVNVSYGAIQAVRDVSIEVPKGEVVTIIGANGAGKSTLLKSVVGLEPVTKGQVFLDGEDITSTPPHRRTGMGVALSPRGAACFRISPSETIFCSELTQRKPMPLKLSRRSNIFSEYSLG